MLKLCTKCDFIGKGKHGLMSGNVYVGALEVILAVLIVVKGGELLQSYIYAIVVGVIVAFAGIVNILDSFSDGHLCANCGRDNLIPVDSLRAKEIIREKNLTLPDESGN